jgi:hypothetical protein
VDCSSSAGLDPRGDIAEDVGTPGVGILDDPVSFAAAGHLPAGVQPVLTDGEPGGQD